MFLNHKLSKTLSQVEKKLKSNNALKIAPHEIILKASQLKGNIKLVFERMIVLVANGMECRKAQKTIADECNISIKTVQRYCKSFWHEGIIVNIKQRFKKSNIYTFNDALLSSQGLKRLAPYYKWAQLALFRFLLALSFSAPIQATQKNVLLKKIDIYNYINKQKEKKNLEAKGLLPMTPFTTKRPPLPIFKQTSNKPIVPTIQTPQQMRMIAFKFAQSDDYKDMSDNIGSVKADQYVKRMISIAGLYEHNKLDEALHEEKVNHSLLMESLYAKLNRVPYMISNERKRETLE